MAIFEVESWYVVQGKEREHDEAMRVWFKWVKAHRDLFPEWQSVRYLELHSAGEDTGRRQLIWEYKDFSEYERYKTRRQNYDGPYAEYKHNDPYHMGVLVHNRMKLEFWKDLERDLWIE